MTVVVGIDQSYTGFGYCTGGVSLKKSFPSGKYLSDIERLAAIRDWFSDWLVRLDEEPAIVAMEGYANAAKFGREAAGELGGVVKLALRDVWGREPLIVPPTSLKKFVTGKGNAQKNQMLLHVYRKWGMEFSDDNQADAYALEKFGEAYLATDRSHLAQYEIEAIDKVRHLV